jgi:hypothetical protein
MQISSINSAAYGKRSMRTDRIPTIMYTVICTSFLLRLFAKFRISFRDTRRPFDRCPPPYAAVHFTKAWSSLDGKVSVDTKSIVLGPDFRSCEARQEMYIYCQTMIRCAGGYSLSHMSTITCELPHGYQVGDTSHVDDIMSFSDRMHIVGKYHELMARDSR